ncbi:hypothetical protein PR202_ga13210 [Eleusine coracana subsp. coracana]|uniref:Uncharacterized protein n=1 Tax=Eleusine coracana subsp. coracana TaxID=191504 RepID=A0AAV5CDH6_ELECO|nr:hypothetical protein PR202_ga13210 [Eleusine coracana subsp. coracana]
MAPPRCMSLGLAVEYADVVHSVVLQANAEDFHRRSEQQFQRRAGLSMSFCRAMLQPTMESFGLRERLKRLWTSFDITSGSAEDA